MDTIQGSIEAIVYVQEENGFTVARLKEPKKKELTTLVGMMPALQPGETISCEGTWKQHPSHGRQFEVETYQVKAPSDLVGIQKYLESGLIKGIGPVFAQKIVDRFGMGTLEVIEHTPYRLLEIPGFGEKKKQSVIACWQEQRSIRDVMIFLRAHGASPAYAQRIFKAYGPDSIRKVQENPYQLAKDIFGIGFKLADGIAQKLGFALHSPERIAAGVEFVLWELSNDGHTCYPKEDFFPLAEKILEVPSSEISAQIPLLIEKKVLVDQEEKLWLRSFFLYEQTISKDLVRLLQSAQSLRSIHTEKAAQWAESTGSIQFAPQQKQAVIEALENKVHIITGGPGTGKSTITNAILAVTSKLTQDILLAAPTGRAAKRLSQITRRKAWTIHALLEMDFSSKGFKRNRDNPLSCDFLVVDEASMIDTFLLFSLLRAVPSHTRLLLVGDADQLPSVGAGTALRDLIQSGLVGVTRLTEIFRQAKGSKIVTNAHRINQGEFPDLYTPGKSDFHFIEAQTPQAIQEVILELVSKEIPRLWHLDPIEQIQVLSPMRRGPIGVDLLNSALQALLNPQDHPLYRLGHRLHVADKVMQIRNNYDKKVYNGDMGRIEAIHTSEQIVEISFEEKILEYSFLELDEIVLAYATSVHKYQGSECPCIVIPMHASHFKLLQRNLLYTAVTRGKKQVYLVGEKRAIGMAVTNNGANQRFTGLLEACKSASLTSWNPPRQLELL